MCIANPLLKGNGHVHFAALVVVDLNQAVDAAADEVLTVGCELQASAYKSCRQWKQVIDELQALGRANNKCTLHAVAADSFPKRMVPLCAAMHRHSVILYTALQESISGACRQ